MHRIIKVFAVMTLSALILTSCLGKVEGDNETGTAQASPSAERTTDAATPTPGDPTETGGQETNQTPDAPGKPHDELVAEFGGLWGRIDGSTATIPLTAALHAHFEGAGAPPQHNTTSFAYDALLYGSSDLIFVTRPSEPDLARAGEMGIGLEVVPVAKDALVFLVNAQNAVDGLSLNDLAKIYAGEISDWGALGGIDEAIAPYQRTEGSGSQTLFLELVMRGREAMEPPSEWVAASMGELIEVVSNNDYSRESIGYSMFYYVNNMYGNDRYKMLGIDGVTPSRRSIEEGEYPLEDYYYAVHRDDVPDGDPIRTLIAWLLTDQGQALAAMSGYIPLRPLSGVGYDPDFDPVYMGEVNESSGTGGTALKSEEERTSAVNENVRKPLSDMFYDGFNYVAHINSEILRDIQRTQSEYGLNLSIEDEYLLRPYSGIPNDYPHYELEAYGEGDGAVAYLSVFFPQGNPFFMYPTHFYVTLTDDISPYGTKADGYAVRYGYAGPLDARTDLFDVRVSMPDAPDAAERINQRLGAWVGGFGGDLANMEALDGFAAWLLGIYGIDEGYGYKVRLQPSVGVWRGSLTVTYMLSDYSGPNIDLPMLWTIAFDMATGEEVSLLSRLPDPLDLTEAFMVVPASFEGGVMAGGYGEGHMEGAPAPGSTVTDAWLIHSTLWVRVTEPDGRVLQGYVWGVTWDD